MQKQGYVGEFEIVDDHRSGKIVIDLIGRINKCGVISPRFDVRPGRQTAERSHAAGRAGEDPAALLGPAVWHVIEYVA